MILLNSRATVALIGLLAACSGPAAQPLYNYSDKSVEQLLTLLDSEDADKRTCAALFIGIRYRNPKLLLVNAPIIKSNSPLPELPMPAKVIDRLSSMLTNDSRPQVRSSVLSALSRIKYRYDTTPIIEQALADKDVFLRLRAADELVSIHEDYKERLGSRVIKTILESVETSQDTETLGRAAFMLGRMGPEAKEALPWLEKLTNHENSYVRRRAAEALAKLKGSKLPQQRTPVIEWISASHLRSYQFRFYDDGTIVSPQMSNPVSPTWTKEQLNQLLAELQRIGFFGIKDQKAYEKIALKSGERYQPESTNQIYPPGNDVIDGSTSTLIVRSHSQTNKATFFMPGLYFKAYPDIAELKIFMEASRLVSQAIAPPKNAPQESGK